jgi:hypothetical protein
MLNLAGRKTRPYPKTITMKKMAITKIQTLVTVFITLAAGTAGAQVTSREFVFKPGDTFLKQTSVNSTSVLQRGDFKLNVSSASTVAKSYQVSDVYGSGYVFNVTTKKITDSINAAGKQMHYNSDETGGNTSQLATNLDFIIGKQLAVYVNGRGVIDKNGTYAPKIANDTLLLFTGIEPDNFKPGSKFGLVSDLAFTGHVQKNYGWSDTLVTAEGKTITRFWVQDKTARLTTIGFKSATTGKSVNTNSNGVYVVNNNSGIIAQRIIQSVSVGYIIYNRVVYASSRRTSIAENCYKIN